MKNKYDKPEIQNTACLMAPMSTPADNAAEKMRNIILNLPDTGFKAAATWYISENGDDSNAGNNAACPWKTLDALAANADKIQSGDAVLFERGGVYRGTVKCISGVTYGAYGTGDKPCVYESDKNYAEAVWKETENNLWKTNIAKRGDIGIVVFDHGADVGFKKYHLEDLKAQGDFYSEGEWLYLYSESPPAKAYKSIETGALNHIFMIGADTHDVVIENITMKYGGGMALQGVNGVKNIVVRGCEMGWLGGCLLPNYKDGNVRFGNGVEFWNGCGNILIEDCWVYQIYDSGLSHQGNGIFSARDITFRRNLIEYCSFGSIEYWAHDQNKNRMENITYSDNILRFAGYGWSDAQRPDPHAVHILSTGKMDHKCINFKITGNILDTAKNCLIACTSKIGSLPDISGNTYIQPKGGFLGKYGGVDSKRYEISEAEDALKSAFGDKKATVIEY